MANTTVIKVVQGNVLRLNIPLQVKIRNTEAGEPTERTEDFYPSLNYPTIVKLTSDYKTVNLDAEVDGNVVKVEDKGTLKTGCYQIEVICKDDNGNPYRFAAPCVLHIVQFTSDADIEAGIEFNSETYTLEGAYFIQGEKGDKGDPFTWEDFTEEEILLLQKPAQDKADEVTELQEQWSEAENQRAQAEQGREQAEGTRQTTFETNERQRQTTFNTNEQARQSGETQRNTNESARQEAERLRAVAEVSRVNAEAQRNTSEQQRQTNEQARSEAEALRVQAESQRQQAFQTAINNAEEATQEAENVNAQLSSDGGVVILTITNRQGNQTSKEVGFRIYKTYPSVAAMNADLVNVEEGKFVMIAGSTQDVDTGKLYVRGASAFSFITDLSGAQGIKGDTGNGIASVTLNADYTLTIVFTDGTSTTTTSIRGEKGEKGDKGDKGDAFTYQDFTPAQIAELQRPATEAAQAAETATQGAENVNASLNGSVVTVTNRQGTSSSIDLLNAAYEVVRVVVTTDVSGVSVSGLVLNIYYNDATTPSDTATTDSNGVATFRVDKDYRYKITFPSIQGCKDIAPVSHVASVSERSIEVEYVEYNPVTEGMQLTVFVADAQATGYAGVGVPNVDVDFTIEGVTETLTTGQDGKVQKIIPYGQSVQVEVPIREGKTLAGSKTRTFVASQASKYAEFVYTTTSAGLFIVTDDGQEYTEEEFENALEQETVTAQDAKLLKVVTEELSSNNGIFYLSLDDLATRSNLPSKQWTASAVQFFDIPLNGNNASQPYYYDGRTASALIQDEGDRRNINTPAVDETLARTFTLGSGGTLKGFLGSVGQWAILWENRFLVDNILTTTRPSAAYNFSTFHTNKWTSTQNGAGYAWYWASAATSFYKNGSGYVVPFFAF